MNKLIFGNAAHIAANKAKVEPTNPMLVHHGKAEGFFSCGECTHLMRRQRKRMVYKCLKRVSEAADHRLGYDACGLFEMKGGR
tara:strand:+ start:374 stop:622 length:249 start_codon:yes stop_codon:yes gene_type:complete